MTYTTGLSQSFICTSSSSSAPKIQLDWAMIRPVHLCQDLCVLQLILQYPNQFEMIKCNPGKNGLDFQLVSYLGYLLKTASKSNYIIVSNDCGFDAVVKFWQDRGMSVIRSNVYHVLQPDAEVQQQTQASFAQAETAKGKRGRYPFNEKRNSQNVRRVHTSNQTVKAEKFAVGNSSEIAANSQSERKISADQPDSNFQKSSQISEQQTGAHVNDLRFILCLKCNMSEKQSRSKVS